MSKNNNFILFIIIIIFCLISSSFQIETIEISTDKKSYSQHLTSDDIYISTNLIIKNGDSKFLYISTETNNKKDFAIISAKVKNDDNLFYYSKKAYYKNIITIPKEI